MSKKGRPLVTFVLITYNQEKFVREAIEAAFAQTYLPLEIIISDDCSTDRTFELINETCASYQGNHNIRVRQTPKNIGTFAHVMHAVKDAHGELIVLAAGDDISKSKRVSKLVSAWQGSGAWGLHSKYDCINDVGDLTNVAQLSEGLLSPEYRLRQYFYNTDGPVEIVHGVASAYDVRIFDYLNEFSEKFILSEDGVLSFALNLLRKKIYCLEDSLVFYREHQGSLTNAGRKRQRSSLEDIVVSEQKNVLYSVSLANRSKMFLELSDFLKIIPLRPINKQEIIRDNKIYNQKAFWIESTFFDRAKFLISSRQSGDVKWIIPRLFGAKLFYLIKLIFHRLKFIL